MACLLLKKRKKKNHKPFSPCHIPSLCPLPIIIYGSIHFTWMTVPGQLSVVSSGTGHIVTDRTPTSLISNLRRHRLGLCLMENLCFVGKLTLRLLKENECSSLRFAITPRWHGLCAICLWAVVTITTVWRMPGVSIKVKHVKTTKCSLSAYKQGKMNPTAYSK